MMRGAEKVLHASEDGIGEQYCFASEVLNLRRSVLSC